MLLAARDQENAVLQAPTQNGKQQKLQGFPKTPGAKKLHHQNENNLGTMKKGKSVLVSNADAFVTPAGPRNRVPLGGKDTNFKTRRKSPEEGGAVLKKPAATPGPAKQGSAKAQRSLKQSITTDTKPAVKSADDDDDYPEIEYMPPKPIDLPDVPDDFIAPNVDFIRKNMYKNIYHDEWDKYAKIVNDSIKADEEDEERMLAESEADARRVLMREEMYDTIGRTRGRKVAAKKGGLVAADKENKVPRGPLKSKNNQANTGTIAAGNKGRPMALHAKTYSTGNVPSLQRKLPSRPNSVQSVTAASMLSQHASKSVKKAPAVKVHNRSASSASILSKVTGGLAYTRPKSAASVRPKVDHRVAEMNSKTSIGYSAGKPLAASVQRALEKGKDDLDFSSSDDEEDYTKGQDNIREDFDDLFQAAGIDINRIDEEDEEFELVL